MLPDSNIIVEMKQYYKDRIEKINELSFSPQKNFSKTNPHQGSVKRQVYAKGDSM